MGWGLASGGDVGIGFGRLSFDRSSYIQRFSSRSACGFDLGLGVVGLKQIAAFEVF